MVESRTQEAESHNRMSAYQCTGVRRCGQADLREAEERIRDAANASGWRILVKPIQYCLQIPAEVGSFLYERSFLEPQAPLGCRQGEYMQLDLSAPLYRI